MHRTSVISLRSWMNGRKPTVNGYAGSPSLMWWNGGGTNAVPRGGGCGYYQEVSESWVSITMQGQVVVQDSTTPCQVVTISVEGMVLLPNQKGTIGMALAVELQPHQWRFPVSLPCVLVREGEYHGNYAWQVQFTELPPDASDAVLELMGVNPPSQGHDPAHSSVIPAADVEPAPRERLRSYSDVFADVPDIEVKEVKAARLDDDDVLDIPLDEDRDLMSEIGGERVDRIFKDALRQLSVENRPKKKKGWFS